MNEKFFDEEEDDSDEDDEEECDCENCTEIEIESSEEIEETEFSMTKDEINEWINELMRLKEEKESVELFIDENNVLKVNYEESDADFEEDEE